MESILLILLGIESDPVTRLVSELGSVEVEGSIPPFKPKTNSNPKHIFPFQSLP